MKRFVLLALLFVVCSTTFSQRLWIEKELQKDVNNTLAVKYPMKDANGNNCGLILVGLVMPDAKFAGNIVHKEYKQGEWWIYMPEGSTSFLVNGTLPCRFPSPIESNATYMMTIVLRDVDKNYLVISTEPSDSKIFINDEYVGKGLYNDLLDISKEYSYRVEAPLHRTEVGKVKLSADTTTTLNIKLKYDCGYLQVNTYPEQGATIEINGVEYTERTPFITKQSSGSYRIQAFKQMYKTAIRDVEVKDGDTAIVNITLDSDYEKVEITLADRDANLYIDGKYISKGSWQGPLATGEHLIEVKKENHYTYPKKVNVIEGMSSTITVPSLQYISGKLAISSKPIGANINIDGKNYGNTPQVIPDDFIIGNHVLTISKDGYMTRVDTIMVSEDKTSEYTYELVKGESNALSFVSTNIFTGRVGDSVYINKKYVGTSPINKYSLKAGKYTIEAKRNGTKVSKDIDITAYEKKTMDIIFDFPESIASNNEPKSVQDKSTISVEENKEIETKLKNRFFFVGDYVYSLAPQTAYGLTIGKVYNRTIGWYVSATSNLVDAFSVTREVRVDNIYNYYYTGETMTMRHSLSFGFLAGWKHFYWKLGGGYGLRTLLWKNTNGNWMTVRENSYEGIEVTTGFQLWIWRFVLSADVVVLTDKLDIQATEPFYWEARVGFGFNF